MKVAVICIFLAGIFGTSLSATKISSTNDEALKQMVEHAKAGVEKILESTNLATDKAGAATLNAAKTLTNDYSQNLENIKAQVSVAAEKLIESYSNNFNNLKSSLTRNAQSIQRQLQPVYEDAIGNFEDSFWKLGKQVPAVNEFVNAAVKDLEEKGKKAFTVDDDKLKEMYNELDQEYQAGLKMLKSSS